MYVCMYVCTQVMLMNKLKGLKLDSMEDDSTSGGIKDDSDSGLIAGAEVGAQA